MRTKVILRNLMFSYGYYIIFSQIMCFTYLLFIYSSFVYYMNQLLTFIIISIYINNIYLNKRSRL